MMDRPPARLVAWLRPALAKLWAAPAGTLARLGCPTSQGDPAQALQLAEEAPGQIPRKALREDLPHACRGSHHHCHRTHLKLLAQGPESLSDDELLAMLLFFAMPKGDSKPLAQALVKRFGSFAAVLAAPQTQLLTTPGLGERGVAALKLVQSAALHLARAEAMEAPLLNNPDRLQAYLASAMGRETVEQFRILFLNRRSRLITDEVIGRGTVDHTPVYVREVVKRALELNATALILAHNHPSGDPTPSRADLEMTAEIRDAAAMLGIELYDHIVVGNGRQVSFRAAGLLPRA